MPQPWWRSAVFYQIYVRSFADSNDDGIGDLPGITSRLEHVRDLGADAIWLTPFYPSPQKDHGYDVADYFDVNPEYGTLSDFDQLLARAHELGLKVLVDIVPNHTSSEHAWFKAAVASSENPFRGRYHFADPRPGGQPPNNWTSSFGGPAWSPEPAGSQWYLHLFAPGQPDLNWWNPAVPEEFERILKFWLDRGADGFRIDVASALFKRRDLADRPLITDRVTGAARFDSAFGIIDQPQLHDVYRRWRQIANDYRPDRVLVGEIFDPRRHSRYIVPDQLHMAFALIHLPWDAELWRRSIEESRRALKGPGVEPSWTLGNHDVTRPVTRLGGGTLGRARAAAALLLLLGLPGQMFIYQGEELGLEEVDLPDSARQDPIFLRSQGRQKGRDGCRVPLPWRRGEPNAGFSSTAPWLPMPVGWDRFAVEAQAEYSGSTLGLYRQALAARRSLAGRLQGRFDWLPAPRGVLAYGRGRLQVACNLTSRPRRLQVTGRLLLASAPLVALRGETLTLGPNSAAWVSQLA
ncbi:MAG TPA: alpha-amylase family glycosyl hydrolase [Candidatus Limnocylindrales bacterium]|nr:alpha-amylase family glycosyl hydrolase [Candidatus Limnocylindrales bacterium]